MGRFKVILDSKGMQLDCYFDSSVQVITVLAVGVYFQIDGSYLVVLLSPS